jgi:hypothetical protein
MEPKVMVEEGVADGRKRGVGQGRVWLGGSMRRKRFGD